MKSHPVPGEQFLTLNFGTRTEIQGAQVLHHLLEELTLITVLIKERFPGSEAESKTDASIEPVLLHILNSSCAAFLVFNKFIAER